jgi:hypothetical protein
MARLNRGAAKPSARRARPAFEGTTSLHPAAQRPAPPDSMFGLAQPWRGEAKPEEPAPGV